MINSPKTKRQIAMAIIFVILLSLPTVSDIYHETLYYTMVFALIPFGIYRMVNEEKFDQKFYQRWHKIREQGYWTNVMREGSRSFFTITIIVCISQFLGNGRTPWEIVSRLPGGILIWILFFLLAFSMIAGIAACHENEKRYNRIKRQTSA